MLNIQNQSFIIWPQLSILPFSLQLWNTAFHLWTHIPIPLTPLIICYLLSPPSFSSYFIQLRLHDLLPQWLFLTSKTTLPYFLPDVPKSGDFELFSSQLFLNYQEHRLDGSELLQTYHIQNQAVTYLTCFSPNQCSAFRSVCNYFPLTTLLLVPNNSNFTRRLKVTKWNVSQFLSPATQNYPLPHLPSFLGDDLWLLFFSLYPLTSVLLFMASVPNILGKSFTSSFTYISTYCILKFVFSIIAMRLLLPSSLKLSLFPET